MRLSAPIQLLIVALTGQSSASPVAAPASSDVEIRDSAELASDTAAAVQKRSYQTSCTNCGISDNGNNPFMECSCRNSAGNWGTSRLYLNNCIANVNGEMQWARGGNFGLTCSVQFGRHSSSHLLSAGCLAPNQVDTVYSTLNPDGRIHNQNGQLAC